MLVRKWSPHGCIGRYEAVGNGTMGQAALDMLARSVCGGTRSAWLATEQRSLSVPDFAMGLHTPAQHGLWNSFSVMM